MRLKEEKALMVIEVVSLLFIALSTFVIEIADYNINQWTSKLLLLQNEENDISNIELRYLLNSHFISLWQFLKAEAMPYTEQDYLRERKYVEKEFIEPWEDFKNKKISFQEYISKIREPLTKKSFELRNKYDHKKEEINNELKIQPRLKLYIFNLEWSLIRGIFSSIRMFAIIVATFLYILLYRSIGQRLKTK